MRTEQEMTDLILSTALADERIRGVYLNGSRANPNAPRDIFQDYDIVYLVRETASFLAQPNWIDVFGKLLIKQLPDELDRLMGKKVNFGCDYGYLMQFEDGNRIDLHIRTLELALQDYQTERMTVTLLDKDDVLQKLPPPTDQDYWVGPPDSASFFRCCNEFWWVSLYVGKGLWRRETLYAMEHLNHYLRPELIRLLSWEAGRQNDFSVSVGKCGKYLERYLPESAWNRLMATFPTADIQEIWEALEAACGLFDDSARMVAEVFEYPYDSGEACGCREFLKKVRSLPIDAKEIC